jgi:2-polyprenyl-3-methyl-5-hydroxy-6-metoxy-1,4-benzoquinol methylase
MRRVRLLRRIVAAHLRREDTTCPYCGGRRTSVVARKYALLHLRRCAACGLGFRWPKDSPGFNAAYYDERYDQPGLTTDLPDDAEVARLVASGFRGTEKDFGEKIALLRAVCPAGRVLDFGASWGYGAVQLRQAGYDVVGFEIGRSRARYGRDRLGVSILSEPAALGRLPAGAFDAVFSNHVLEHLPEPASAFDTFARLLRPGGVLLAFVPNAGGVSARCLGPKWGPLLCERHTLAIDADFVEGALARHGFRVRTTSEPYSVATVSALLERDTSTALRDGDELLILARRSAGLPARCPAAAIGIGDAS